MKTLFVAPQLPWPLDVGSKIRIHNLLRCYGEIGAVTLVCFAQKPAEAEYVPQLAQYGYRIYCLPLLVGAPTAGWFGLLRRAMHPQPWSVQYFNCPEFTRRVKALIDSENFDILHVERLFMAQHFNTILRNRSKAHRPCLIIDIDDLESEKMRRMAAIEPRNSWKKYLHSIEHLKLHAYERRVLIGFDYALVCSEKDQRQIQRNWRSLSVEVFSNGADINNSAASEENQDDGRTLVFLGAMDYQPNEDAAIFFTESVFAYIRRRAPDVRFVIAGKSPSAKVRALDNGRDIFVTGYVQDKDALFNSCTVFIVPLRLGGGTRIKILEAMAAGKPVVSTTVGCEGIDVAPGQNIMIADAAEDFANACTSLLLHETKRQAIGRAGKELVLRRYRWEEIRRDYVTRLEDCLRRPGITRQSQLLSAVRTEERS